jgi:hypothetical protein
MRITIIALDKWVSVDGEGYSGLDLSFLPQDIHAVQWYGIEGDVEYRDERGRATKNEEITDFSPFQNALEVWRAAKELYEQSLAQQIIEAQNEADLNANTQS